MYKVKMIFINILYSALLGFLMQFVWVFAFNNRDQFAPRYVLNMMTISAIIGTICMFSLFFVALKISSKVKIVIINMVIAFLLCGAVYLETGIVYSNWSFDLKWGVILFFSEIAAIVLTTMWYNKIKLYNDKLAQKKASLQG